MTRDRLDNVYEAPGAWADQAACAKSPAGTFLVVVQLLRPSARPLSAARSAHAHADRAKRICMACPVLVECREWALTEPDPAYDLVAGGLDPVERSRIRRDREARQ